MGRLLAALRAGPELISWWAVLMGTWIITLSSINLSELAVSAGCALPCAVGALAARRAMGISWSPSVGWLRWLIPLPAAVVTDAVRVLTVPLRRALRGGQWAGELREQALPSDEPARRSAARRALATIAVSSTPGTFVVDADAGRRRLVVHSLVEGSPRMERVVSR